MSIDDEDFPDIKAGQKVDLLFKGHKEKVFVGKVAAKKSNSEAKTKKRSVFVEMFSKNCKYILGTTGQTEQYKAERKDAPNHS